MKKMFFDEKVSLVYMMNYKLTRVVFRVKMSKKSSDEKVGVKKETSKSKTHLIYLYMKLTSLHQ